MGFCVPFHELSLSDVDLVGGKTASLGEMIGALVPLGVRVPPGFAVTADAYSATLERAGIGARLRELFADLDPEDAAQLQARGRQARHLIADAGLPADVAAEIREHYRMLAEQTATELSVAVRSSATAEDLPQASFAGQQATYLNVRGEAALLQAVLACFSSVFTDRAISYRYHHGFDHLSIRGAVAVQQMVRSDRGSAGVAFTLDPDTGTRSVVVINGAWGLGESVVSGQVDPDEVIVFKGTLESASSPIIRRKIGNKQVRVVYAQRAAATRTVAVSLADQKRRCFSDEDALQLAKWAVLIERHYSGRAGKLTPMDIEWAKDGLSGELFIVQARPETVHARADTNELVQFRLEHAPQPVLHGIAIGSAVGQGNVRVVHSVEDLPAFRHGEVLVTDMTDPDWVPAIKKAAAVVTNRGGRTCHAAIVTRELGVPCVVGTQHATERLATGSPATVSCATGSIGEVYDRNVEVRRERIPLDDLPKPATKVMVILADPDRAFEHARLPSDGVGLVRQEFVIANHIGVHPSAVLHPDRLAPEVASRIEQLAAGYPSPAAFWRAKLAEGLGMLAAAFYPKDVIVRLSDFKTNEYRRLLGGETFEPIEENPMIGLRGASRYLHPRFADAFELECSALVAVRRDMGLRNVKLMVPFCRTAEEGQAVIERLGEQGLRRGEDGLEIWVMCEIPANVVAVDRFSQVFDGFSIGSNDLTQLVLGVDRDSELLAGMFQESDVAVTRTIAQAIEGAHRCGRLIGLCGQAPSDNLEFARFLVECGIDSISVNPDVLIRALGVIADAEK